MNDSTRETTLRLARGGLPAFAACLGLAACGGGGGDSPSPTSGTPPTSPAPAPTPPSDPAPTPDPTPAPDPTPPPSPTAPDPAPTPAATKSAKRGVAYDLADPSDLAALSPGVSWWYNWGLKPSNGVPADYRSRYGMDYIPMLWNFSFDAAQVEAFLKANPSIKFLLLLNEPNLNDQSNQTPQQAAQMWPRYEAIAASTRVKLVGPAITWGTMAGFSDPVVWLDAFYAEYRKANGNRDPHIDYIAFHWYDYGLNDQLQRLTKYGKPFWVTEFANWHSQKDGAQIDSVAKQKAQMTDMVAVCENRSDVFRYAWFTGRWTDEATRHTSLLAATGQLTELGTHYLNQPYWVSAWGVSPQSENVSFDKQTLRQIVHTSVGGVAARIRLSNMFGSQPITVTNVHIARRTTDASIDASTDRALTFGGQASITLPAGGGVYSDRVAFTVTAQTDVAVSFYLPNATPVTTGQSTGGQDTYVAAGNVSGNASITVTDQDQNYHLLTNLDVQGNALLGSVPTFGASIAAGADVVDAAGPSAENRFDRDVRRQTGIRLVIYADALTSPAAPRAPAWRSAQGAG